MKTETHNVDTTEELTHVSLCAGYGGLDLGLKRVLPNLRTVALCEVEAYACANLVAKMEAGLMDAAPIWSNLKTFPWSDFRDRVDILSGGYPCQPFSAAGKRLGTNDERHLWPFIADGVRILRPKVCFFENVEGHITLGLSTVVSDLEELGYKVSFGLFSATEVGAPHQRKRVFVLAYRCGEGLEGREWLRKAGAQGAPSGHFAECRDDLWPSRPGEPQHWWEPPRVVGDAEGERPAAFRPQHEGLSGELCAPSASGAGVVGDAQHTRLEGQRNDATSEHRRNEGIQPRPANGDNFNAGKTEPKVGGDVARTTSGVGYGELCVSCDNRTDELRMLGNGVVPATAAKAFVTLINQLKNNE